MKDVRVGETARPTPLELANIAFHVRAATILLYEGTARGTCANLESSFVFAPFHQLIYFRALAFLAVISLPARVANLIVAHGTLYQSPSLLALGATLLDSFLSHRPGLAQIYYKITIRRNAKHQIFLVESNSLRILKLKVLFEDVGTDESLDFF